MKKNLAILILATFSFCSCKKESNTVADVTGKSLNATPESDNYVKYTIAKGDQYCDKNYYVSVKYQQLSFKVKFDSSAIYETLLAGNQTDINKLYGFSDNNALHHMYSARFGWRWSDNALRLFGYIYNSGVMSFKELGAVGIGDEISCSIKVTANAYIFSLNGSETTMPRESTTAMAEGYKLYPYFGGDEFAPHAISIWIKEF